MNLLCQKKKKQFEDFKTILSRRFKKTFKIAFGSSNQR